MHEPQLKDPASLNFKVAEAPPAILAEAPETQFFTFNPEDPAEWEPAVVVFADAYVQHASVEEVAAQGDFSIMVDGLLQHFKQQQEAGLTEVMDPQMRDFTQIKPDQLRPVLQRELQRAAKSALPLAAHVSDLRL